MKAFLLAGITGLWAVAAWAHSPLETSVPADGAVIDAAPAEIILDFRGGMRLTRVTLTYEDADPLDLDLDARDEFISDYAIAMQGRGAGAYLVTWRGLSEDGHVISGSFSFTVQ